MNKRLTAEELRLSIIEKAVTGKLVKHISSEGTGNDVATLIRNIRKVKVSPINEDEIEYDVPETWALMRLKEVAEIYTGNSINEEEKNKNYRNCEGYDYIGTKDVNFDKTITYDNGVNIPTTANFKLCPSNKILMCIEGGSAGRKIAITNRDVCFGNKLACFNTVIINDEYLFYFLQSNQFKKIFKDNLNGIIGGVSVNTLKDLPIAIPPLEEQKRIVDKIKELEPLLNEYDKVENELNVLEEDLPIHFIDSITQYALEGKLYNNDNDLSLNGYLDKCQKESKISHSHIEDIPFEIPSNWEWCYLPEIANFKLGKTPERGDSKWWSNDYPWFSIADMKEKQIIIDHKEGISSLAFKEKFGENISPKGTLIMSFKLTVGRVSILGVDGLHNEAIISIFPYVNDDYITRDYLFYFIGFLTRYCEKTDAIKGSTLNKEKLRKLPIPIPPLNVQKEIVARIKNILSKIDL